MDRSVLRAVVKAYEADTAAHKENEFNYEVDGIKYYLRLVAKDKHHSTYLIVNQYGEKANYFLTRF